ncbi:glycoside hydrolase family 1 protein [Peterkaempfera bronchialis]|uniref:glycoside hydrolase family 1 protein n=1 Tax=Peterkaempfera bronchialis TaxID=2126346 RepID=UPI003C2B35D0
MAASIAAPPTGGERMGAVVGGVEPSAYADRWSRDVRAVVGVAPTGRRAVLGWPHVQPEGPGTWDAAALDRCDRWLDAVLAAGLRPSLSLVHLDLPSWIEDAGGWLARDTAFRFADFADEMGRRFGDRVTRWVTVADMAAVSVSDYVAGMCPPGRGLGAAGLPALHHMLLGHGLALRALRGAGVRGEVGGGLPLMGGYAATGDPWDRIALERFESWTNRLFLDPLLLGRHMVPEDGVSPVDATGCVRPGDMEIIATPQDVLGLSWFAPCRVTTPENLPVVLPPRSSFWALNDVNRLLVRLGFALTPFDEVATTAYGWPIMPEGLADVLSAVHDIYGDLLPPLHITDVGMGDMDTPGPLPEVERKRRSLFGSRLSWLADVLADGMDIRGYEYWSVTDNLEWVVRYARLYGAAVCEGEPVPQPPIPMDWVRGAAFAEPGPVGAVGASRMVLCPPPRSR